MPAPKSPKTGFGLTTQSSLAVREARLARAYGEDGRARDAPPTARRATKEDAPRALRLSLGEEAGTVRALAPKPTRKRPDRPRSPSRRSPEPASASPDRGPARAPTITIRVLDDARNTRREFSRELKPVLREMPYFRAHLAGRVDEAVLREIADERGDGSDASAEKDASFAAARPRGKRDAPASRLAAKRERAKDDDGRHVDVTVRCDVDIFSRLLAYVDAKSGSASAPLHSTPPLTVRDCVPVLVASEFLGMRALARTCVAFLASALPAVVALRPGVGVENLGEETLARLAALVSEETLEHAVAVIRASSASSETTDDRDGANVSFRTLGGGDGGSSDADEIRARRSVRRASSGVAALPSRLYALKLKTAYLTPSRASENENETENEGDDRDDVFVSLSRCALCARVFPTEARDFLACASAKSRSVAFDGGVVAPHCSQKRFDSAAFIDALLEAHDPRHVYWYLWGATRVLPACARCGARGVAAAEMDACRYHPNEAIFDRTTTTNDAARDASNDVSRCTEISARAVGVRPCCGARAPRFDAADALLGDGCRRREHVWTKSRVAARGASATLLATARRRRALVVEPDPLDLPSAKDSLDANGVYLAGDHANLESLPLFCRVSGGSVSSVSSEGDEEGDEAGFCSRRRRAWPRGAFGKKTEPETETSSRSSRSSDALGSASDTLELSSASDADSASDAESDAARARLRVANGKNANGKKAPEGPRPAPRRPERPDRDPYRGVQRARALRGRAAAAAAGTARAAKSASRREKFSRREHAFLVAPASPSTFSFGLPKDAYDALPEKLRRAVRRDALREADAARVAELERELRALRRDESVALA